MADLLRKALGGNRRRVSKPMLIALWIVPAAAVLWLLFHLGDVGGAFAEMWTYLQYKFILRALIVGVLVSLCAALLGVSLVLKHYSMIGDGLSHVGFGALTVALAMGTVSAEALPGWMPESLRRGLAGLFSAIAEQPLPFTLAVVVLCAFLLLRISSRNMRGDSAIALISTSALALGVIVTSTTSGMNLDVSNYMFGSILAMSDVDVALSIALSAVVLILFLLFYPRIFAITFDETFARATGMRVGPGNMLIAALTAVTVVVGMRMMGTLLISSLIIFPALTAMRVFDRFRPVVLCAAAVSIGCFLAGMMLSCLYAIPTGAGIVGVNLFAFLVFSAVGALRR